MLVLNPSADVRVRVGFRVNVRVRVRVRIRVRGAQIPEPYCWSLTLALIPNPESLTPAQGPEATAGLVEAEGGLEQRVRVRVRVRVRIRARVTSRVGLRLRFMVERRSSKVLRGESGSESEVGAGVALN